MTTITSKLESDIASANLCGRMVSLDPETRRAAAYEAQALLAELPKFLRNSPHCRDEINILKTLAATQLSSYAAKQLSS